MNKLAVAIRPINFEQTYPLRHAVLWPEKPLAYVKVDEDALGHHFGAFHNEALVAVISLFVSDGVARFRKFAAHPDYQRLGIGTQLLNLVIAKASELGAHTIWCDSRLDASDFYLRFGMQPEGDVFYKGTIPYSRMSRSLVYRDAD